MSDQPAIPAITVFPPFNPAPRREEPAPEPAREHAPEPAAEHAEPVDATAQPEPGTAWDAPAAAAPMPWDFEAPADEAPTAPEASAADARDDDEDLPWLEVPSPREAEPAADAEIRAEDTPNFMDWMRTEDQPSAGATEDADGGVPEIGDFAADAQPWAPEVENATDDWASETPAEPWKGPETEEPWKAPEESSEEWKAPQDPPADAWQAPATEAGQPWDVPAPPSAGWETPSELDVPEPELYDLPDVPPSPAAAQPWDDIEAPMFVSPEAAAEPEPAWEMPADTAAPDQRPAWESFAAESVEDAVAAEWSAPEAQPEPTPAAQPVASEAGEPRADVSGAFAEVADRLQSIADRLRSDPAAFLAGGQGGGDPLALLVTGFVLGYQARGHNS